MQEETLYKKIPPTNKDFYISGWEALNTPDKNGLTADWHAGNKWLVNKHSDTIKLYPKSMILGDSGIEKRKIIYSGDREVYIANFPRAIADILLFDEPVFHKELNNCVDDFLTDEEAKELYKYVLLVNKVEDVEWFLKYELTKLHFNNRKKEGQ